MKKLYNNISNNQLNNNILFQKSRLIISFYKYFSIDDPKYYSNKIYRFCLMYNILGRIYIAKEGINAQISLPKNCFILIKNFLYELNQKLNNLYINKGLSYNKEPFHSLSIKIKKKIVNDGIQNSAFKFQRVGIYIQARQVNEMINDTKTLFLDMRNSYEYEIGHFHNAIEIKSKTFREQLKKVIKLMSYAKNKKIVMYCTGGIRCEKATSWMIFNGFKHVYHIKGGIIGYVNDAKKNKLPIFFKGSNFVFDNRMREKISNDIISFCKQCNRPSDNYVNCNFHLCHVLFIQCKNCNEIFNNCCSVKCMKSI